MKNSIPLLTTRDAAGLLGVSVRRVGQFCESGRISGQKMGRDWLFPAGEIERFGRIPRPEGRPKTSEKVKGR